MEHLDIFNEDSLSQIHGLGDHIFMLRLSRSCLDSGIEGAPLVNIKVHKISLEIHRFRG